MYNNVNNRISSQPIPVNAGTQTPNTSARTLDDWLNYTGGWIPCNAAPIPIHLSTQFLSAHLRERSPGDVKLYLPMLAAFHGDAEMEGRTFFKGGLLHNNKQVFHFHYKVDDETSGSRFYTAHCYVGSNGQVTKLSFNPKLPPSTLENAQASLNEIRRKLSKPQEYGELNFASDPIMRGGMMGASTYPVPYLIEDLKNPQIDISTKLDRIIELNHRVDFGRCTLEDKWMAVLEAQTFLNTDPGLKPQQSTPHRPLWASRPTA